MEKEGRKEAKNFNLKKCERKLIALKKLERK
jgi:hypothetical protein